MRISLKKTAIPAPRPRCGDIPLPHDPALPTIAYDKTPRPLAVRYARWGNHSYFVDTRPLLFVREVVEYVKPITGEDYAALSTYLSSRSWDEYVVQDATTVRDAIAKATHWWETSGPYAPVLLVLDIL